ncbi:SET domain-containing protein-lysine N-methyltransferase [Patescibacteria group bacterium]|nr:SET domain-containing protein-lysine N-methyltransferase [Patescibacteria group bacterium]
MKFVDEWAKITDAKFSNQLEFETPRIREGIRKKIEKLYKKGELTRQQLWFGAYFRKEIESLFIPDIEIRYIPSILGYGIFATRDFAKMEFIAQYSGIVRKARRSDRTNAYCFEYTLANGVKTPFTIDAQDQGGIGRLINHSEIPNLQSSLATIDFINYIILITSRPVKKGEQLCYDYGDDYWSHREKPVHLS